MPTLADFVAGLPKAELHLHLEGTLQPATLLRLAERNRLDFPYESEAAIEAALAARPPGLQGFLDHHYVAVSTLCTGDDVADVMYDAMGACRDENIVYSEFSFDPQFHAVRGIHFDELIGGIERGRSSGARDFGVRAELVMCINRERSEESALEMLDWARPYRDRIVALGMDSYEEGNPPSKFTRAFARARDEGYGLTAHCDVDQTNSVRHLWECLDVLGVDRIDHGLNAVDDPGLIAALVERGVGLTACPVRRATDPEPQDLGRIRALFEAGVTVGLNSDDPAEFETGWLSNLMVEVAVAGGYDERDLVRFMEHTFEMSFLSREDKDRHIAELRAYAEGV